MYTNIIFDIDGTMMDSNPTSAMAAQKVFLDHSGIEYPLSELEILYGVPVYQMGAYGFPMPELPVFMEQYRIAYTALAKDHNKFFPDVEKLIYKLHEKKIPLGIVTSRERWEYDLDFAALEMNEFFSPVFCIEDTDNHKPHPEPVELFYEQTGLDKAGGLFIGDTVSDMHCAHAAGIDFAYAGWNGQPPIKDADIVLAAPLDLLKYVE